jgi:exodeoxyribonuclease VII small subunit
MSKKNQPLPRNFEEALAELEQILSDIESGQVGLEQSLLKYERGSFLVRHCREVLDKAEKQIELLSKSPEGQLISEPFDDERPSSSEPAPDDAA